jgi:hypothetical protein
MAQMTDTDVKMPYDKHDAQLVAKAFQNLWTTRAYEEKKLLFNPNVTEGYNVNKLDYLNPFIVIAVNMNFAMREET